MACIVSHADGKRKTVAVASLDGGWNNAAHMEQARPKVGVGVIVRKDGKVLLGRRKGAHGAGSWSFPGGHLEFGESIESCAEREVLEETGMRIKNITPVAFTNDIFADEDRHYATLFAVVDHGDGDPYVKEPDRCEEWKWFAWDGLPQPLFLPVRHLLEQGFDPFRT